MHGAFTFMVAEHNTLARTLKALVGQISALIADPRANRIEIKKSRISMSYVSVLNEVHFLHLVFLIHYVRLIHAVRNIGGSAHIEIIIKKISSLVPLLFILLI